MRCFLKTIDKGLAFGVESETSFENSFYMEVKKEWGS
jgi:hypothetical protein